MKFKKALHSTHPILDYSYNHSFSKVRIVSPEIVHDLTQHGVGGKKTFTLEWPRHIATHLVHHFTRGYFDGDGSAYHWENGHKSQTTFSVTGNHAFISSMQAILAKHCDLRSTSLQQRKINTPIFTMLYCGNAQIKRIHDFLYNDATVFMTRKKIAMDQCAD